MALISSRVRRAHFGALGVVVVACAVAACVFAVVIGDRVAVRVDVTSTRAYSLSERTSRMLAELETGVEVVVSVSGARVTEESFGRVMDVLGEFAARAPGVRVSAIDTLSAGAVGEQARVIERLAGFERAEIGAQREEMLAAAAEGERGAAVLERAALALERLGEAIGGDALVRNLEDAATARALAEGARRGAVVVREAAAHRERGVGVPAVDVAIAGVAPVEAGSGRRRGAFGDALIVARGLAEFGEARGGAAGSEGEAGRALAGVAREAEGLLSSAVDRLVRQRSLETLRIARALGVTDVVLVVSERGSAVVRFESLFPLAGDGSDSMAGTRFAGEELLSIAIATATRASAPVLVIVHGEGQRVLSEGGRASHRSAASMARLIDRLRARGVTVAEWAVAAGGEVPSRAALGVEGERALVWFFAGVPREGEGSLVERERRLALLGDGLRGLLDAGERVLVSLEPSGSPAVGSEDPLASVLGDWGIVADVGRPLITRVASAGVEAFSAYQSARGVRGVGASRVSEPLEGLPLMLHWATALEIDGEVAERTGVDVGVVLEVAGEGETWGESRWRSTGMRYANDDQPLRALRSASPPAFDAGRDLAAGPWTVGVAAERVVDGASGGVQRVVVVSAAGWYQDVLAEQRRVVDGRGAFAFPGNAELFDAALAYLSGDDDLIAASARTRDIARIDASLSSGTLEALRWVLRLGLPVVVLGLGLVVWVVRR